MDEIQKAFMYVLTSDNATKDLQEVAIHMQDTGRATEFFQVLFDSVRKIEYECEVRERV